MLSYPIVVSRDEDGAILVTAPDLPEVTTFGSTEEETEARAADSIATALQGRITDRVPLPRPSRPVSGQAVVNLPALIWAKLELYRALIETGTRKSELARRLGVHPPQVDRLFDLDHASRLDQIERAAQATGRELHIEVRPAA